MSTPRCASWLYPALSDPRGVVKKVIKDLREVEKTHPFEAIAVQGLSGLLIGPIVAMLLKKPLLAVRKESERCHSNEEVEGDIDVKSYIIIDDFISSGATCRRIQTALWRKGCKATCVGAYLHYESKFKKEWAGKKQLEDQQRGETKNEDRRPSCTPPLSTDGGAWVSVANFCSPVSSEGAFSQSYVKWKGVPEANESRQISPLWKRKEKTIQEIKGVRQVVPQSWRMPVVFGEPEAQQQEKDSG